MGKQQLIAGTAMAAIFASGTLISSAAAAQAPPEQSAEGADFVPGQSRIVDGEIITDRFNRELRAMGIARSANDCDAWEAASARAMGLLGRMREDRNFSYDYISETDLEQLSGQHDAARAQGCQTLNEQQSGEGLDVVSVIDVASEPGENYEFIIAQLQDLGMRCENSDGDDQEFLESQKDRYGRYYREIEALEDGFRELSLTTDDRETADDYAANARKYEEALEGLPKPWEFPCSNETTPADTAVEGRDFTVASKSGLRIPILRVLHGGAAYGRETVPSTGIGFRREGPLGTALETFATETPDSVDGFGVSAVIYLDGFALDGNYREGDASSSSSIAPNSGVDSGIVYGELSPGGSSGIATPFGLDSEIEAEMQSYGIYGWFDVYNATDGGSRWDTFSADSIRNQLHVQSAGVKAGYQHIERDYLGAASYSGAQNGFTFEFEQKRDQEISEDQFHLGLEADIWLAFTDRIAARSTVGAGGYYRDTSLDSVEVNQNNFSGGPDEMFTVTIERDDDGIGFQGNVDLFIDFNLSPGPGPGPILSIGGGVEYQSSTGGIFNPSSGDQVFFDGLTTDLETDDTFRWFAGASITAPF